MSFRSRPLLPTSETPHFLTSSPTPPCFFSDLRAFLVLLHVHPSNNTYLTRTTASGKEPLGCCLLFLFVCIGLQDALGFFHIPCRLGSGFFLRIYQPSEILSPPTSDPGLIFCSILDLSGFGFPFFFFPLLGSAETVRLLPSKTSSPLLAFLSTWFADHRAFLFNFFKHTGFLPLSSLAFGCGRMF